MLLEPHIRYPHILRPRDDDALTRLVHVVLHAEVGCYPVHQHSVVRRHGWEFVGNLLPILRELDQILLDLQQHCPILVIAINGLRDELLQVYPGAVRVQFRAAVCERTWLLDNKII